MAVYHARVIPTQVKAVPLTCLTCVHQNSFLAFRRTNSLKANKNNQHSAHKINPTQAIVHISPMASEHASSDHTHDMHAAFELKKCFYCYLGNNKAILRRLLTAFIPLLLTMLFFSSLSHMARLGHF